MTKQVYLGTKVRRLRRRKELTQAQLAKHLGISASYLNLIEHNKRTLTVPLLLRLAQVLEVDLAGLAADDEASLVAELSEAFSDAVFDGQDVGREDVADLASHAPGAARAVLHLYRSYRAVRDDAQTMAARLSDDVTLTTVDARLPPEEVSDMLQERRNHFALLEDAAERLREDAALEQPRLESGLLAYFRDELGVTVEVVPARTTGGAARLFDPDDRTLLLSEMLPRESIVFQLAHQAGLIVADATIGAILADCALSTDISRALARVTLANYFAGALMMPYEPFLQTAEQTRYDLEVLQHRFHASFEQVCHRLTTLSRPDDEGVPFHFVRIDIAGNISKRYSGSGIRISRYSGACPRWNVHTAFMTPGQIQKQISRMPDGTGYFCIARTVLKAGGGHHAPATHLALGLGCKMEHARRLVYADGVNLDNPDAAVPIGSSCRVCERTDCRQRAFPPLDHPFEVDPNRRGASFYS